MLLWCALVLVKDSVALVCCGDGFLCSAVFTGDNRLSNLSSMNVCFFYGTLSLSCGESGICLPLIYLLLMRGMVVVLPVGISHISH